MMTRFSSTTLVKAMAPIAQVLESFHEETSNLDDELEKQTRFAEMIQSLRDGPLGPSERYLRNLVRRFMRETESKPGTVQDDILMELVLWCSLSTDLIPNGNETCHQLLIIPSQFTYSGLGKDDNNDNEGGAQDKQVVIRVYPLHNDVALKLWEAGAFLAEFMLRYPEMFREKVIVETGAGVGLTGFVCSSCCAVTSIHLTDYTHACLENLSHNIQLNQDLWKNNPSKPEVTCGYLDWESYAKGGEGSIPDDTDLLIAADVMYDTSAVEALTGTVHRFLKDKPGRCALFATSVRNRKTFDEFEEALEKLGIAREYETVESLAEIPAIFPVYHRHPRSEIRICQMKIIGKERSLNWDRSTKC